MSYDEVPDSIGMKVEGSSGNHLNHDERQELTPRPVESEGLDAVSAAIRIDTPAFTTIVRRRLALNKAARASRQRNEGLSHEPGSISLVLQLLS